MPGASAGGRPLSIGLLSYRSNPYSGGQGVYVKFLSRALADLGHRVEVISGPPYPELDSRVRLVQLPSLDLFAAKSHLKALRPRHLLSYTDFFEWCSMATGGFAEPYTFGRRLVRHFSRRRPQYDVLHDNQSLCYGTLALQRLGFPLVTTIHHPITSDLAIALEQAENWKLRLLARRWHSFLAMQKRVARRLRHLVTVSRAARQDIAAAFGLDPAAIHLVANGIDTALFRPRGAGAGAGEPGAIVTSASADVPMKGLEYLLQALAQLRPTRPELRLLLLGPLKPEGRTARLIAELGLGDAIEVHSGLSGPQVARLYQRAQLAVTPSVYEGFGLPTGEAMASGLAVIATDGGALPEVVGEAGVIVPARSPEALAQALASLLDSPARRQSLGKAARQRIVRHFTWGAAAGKMARLYRQAIDSQQAQAA